MSSAKAGLIGRSRPRIDGPAKVTGRARYASDEVAPNPAHAFLVTSAIARGRVLKVDSAEAGRVPGVLDILTHANVGHLAKPPAQAMGGGTTTTLESDRVWHAGQIIAVVVAETYEAAREAARKVRVDYARDQPTATFDCPGAEVKEREPGEHEDFDVGNADRAFASAEVRLEAEYGTPTQHHNPIELFTTTCAWSGGELTIWEPSQFVYGLRANVARQLGINPEKVRVLSSFVGGAFGSRGGTTARTAWIAIAARRLGRPVKLVATRDQGYTIATCRAETRHHIRLGANRWGRLVSLRHEGWEVTSRPSHYNVSGTETTARIYACPNIRTRVSVVHADRATPGFMRAPPETPYMFALESAMDELAGRLGIDPIELRRINEARTDPVSGRRFSSRRLADCFAAGSRRFGWKRRDPRPGSMREGDWLVGYGCATAAYPANIAATAARVTLFPDGRARVQLAAHDIGTGAYTVAAATAAERLGIPDRQVEVEMGDSRLPPASLAAGSSHTASIAHAIARACDRAREEKRRRGRKFEGAIEAYAENIPEGLPPDAMAKLYEGRLPMLDGMDRSDCTAYSFGAQFVEVRVHRLTCEIRVPRMVGAFACGRIVNPLTARSQLQGGMIWGLGAALLEETEIDRREARYVNRNISEYLVATNADVGSVEAILLPEQDKTVNPLGIKGMGEIGIVGVNAAIANAVHHATGIRVRRLPIRIEDLLGPNRSPSLDPTDSNR